MSTHARHTHACTRSFDTRRRRHERACRGFVPARDGPARFSCDVRRADSGDHHRAGGPQSDQSGPDPVLRRDTSIDALRNYRKVSITTRSWTDQ
jgi:hypothetical protein